MRTHSAFFRPRYVFAFAGVAVASGAAAVAIAGAVPTGHARSERAIPQHATVAATPTAADFGSELAGVMNQAAREHGDPARIQRPSCVQASPAHYMCTYVVGNPGKPPEC